MDTTKKVILIIEDDFPLQSAYRAALTKSGYEVIFSVTGNDGMQKAKSESPQLIILDLMLPGGMNGFDILEQLKADEKLAKIPVFVLTNLDSEENSAINIGANKYFVKTNISIDDVVNEVDIILKDKTT